MTIRMTLGEKVYQVGAHLIVVLVALVCLVPFIYVVSISITPIRELNMRGGYVLIPNHITWAAYKLIIGQGTIPHALMITVARVLVGTLLHLIISSSAGYALSKTHLPGYRFFVLLVLIAFLFGPGLIPYYLLLRSLHMVNTFWVMVVPGAAGPGRPLAHHSAAVFAGFCRAGNVYRRRLLERLSDKRDLCAQIEFAHHRLCAATGSDFDGTLLVRRPACGGGRRCPGTRGLGGDTIPGHEDGDRGRGNRAHPACLSISTEAFCRRHVGRRGQGIALMPAATSSGHRTVAREGGTPMKSAKPPGRN